MSQFLGTHPNKLDAKGRVSIPAPFRAALRNGEERNGDGESSLVLRPHHTHRCIDGFAASYFHTLASSMARLDLFSADQEDLAIALYADAVELAPDKEGRIVLPQNLIAWAGLDQGATFVGMGRQFQIWSPEAAARRAAEARLGVQSRRLAVPAPGIAMASAQGAVP
jgi:transcriptional regulator MraZ